jgi:hypothetical protein
MGLKATAMVTLPVFGELLSGEFPKVPILYSHFQIEFLAPMPLFD